jgi:phage/plasmid-like protein (TIGR03299 family)
MAHNIGQMFYYGEVPWHGLGKRLDQPANIEEAIRAGGLDWEVELVPLMTGDYPPSPVTQRVAVARKDIERGHKSRVVGVVHPGFKPLQNREGAMIFDSLLAQGAPLYHTGGFLGNGEVVWLLAKLPENIRVQGEDVLETYFLYTNSHDGSVAIDIRLTTVRVVCQNTLSMALHQGAKKHVFRRAHQGSYGLIKAEAAEFFEFTKQQVKQAEERFQRLSAEPCDDQAFQRFLEKLFPDPARPATAATNPAVRKSHETRLETIRATRREVLSVHRQGIEGKTAQKIEPAPHTWWGALNSVTAWADHVQETEGDRYAHILLGNGDRLKSAALAKIEAEIDG